MTAKIVAKKIDRTDTKIVIPTPAEDERAPLEHEVRVARARWPRSR